MDASEAARRKALQAQQIRASFANLQHPCFSGDPNVFTSLDLYLFLFFFQRAELYDLRVVDLLHVPGTPPHVFIAHPEFAAFELRVVDEGLPRLLDAVEERRYVRSPWEGLGRDRAYEADFVDERTGRHLAVRVRLGRMGGSLVRRLGEALYDAGVPRERLELGLFTALGAIVAAFDLIIAHVERHTGRGIWDEEEPSTPAPEGASSSASATASASATPEIPELRFRFSSLFPDQDLTDAQAVHLAAEYGLVHIINQFGPEIDMGALEFYVPGTQLPSLSAVARQVRSEAILCAWIRHQQPREALPEALLPPHLLAAMRGVTNENATALDFVGGVPRSLTRSLARASAIPELAPWTRTLPFIFSIRTDLAADLAGENDPIQRLEAQTRASVRASMFSTTAVDPRVGGQLRHPHTPVGLRNIGNTCYLNAIMQSLFHLRPLRETLLRVDWGPSYQRAVLDSTARVVAPEVRRRARRFLRLQRLAYHVQRLFTYLESSIRTAVAPEDLVEEYAVVFETDKAVADRVRVPELNLVPPRDAASDTATIASNTRQAREIMRVFRQFHNLFQQSDAAEFSTRLLDFLAQAILGYEPVGERGRGERAREAGRTASAGATATVGSDPTSPITPTVTAVGARDAAGAGAGTDGAGAEGTATLPAGGSLGALVHVTEALRRLPRKASAPSGDAGSFGAVGAGVRGAEPTADATTAMTMLSMSPARSLSDPGGPVRIDTTPMLNLGLLVPGSDEPAISAPLERESAPLPRAYGLASEERADVYTSLRAYVSWEEVAGATAFSHERKDLLELPPVLLINLHRSNLFGQLVHAPCDLRETLFLDDFVARDRGVPERVGTRAASPDAHVGPPRAASPPTPQRGFAGEAGTPLMGEGGERLATPPATLHIPVHTPVWTEHGRQQVRMAQRVLRQNQARRMVLQRAVDVARLRHIVAAVSAQLAWLGTEPDLCTPADADRAETAPERSTPTSSASSSPPSSGASASSSASSSAAALIPWHVWPEASPEDVVALEDGWARFGASTGLVSQTTARPVSETDAIEWRTLEGARWALVADQAQQMLDELESRPWPESSDEELLPLVAPIREGFGTQPTTDTAQLSPLAESSSASSSSSSSSSLATLLRALDTALVEELAARAEVEEAFAAHARTRYRLRSVVVHRGDMANTGHYVCYTRPTGSSDWFLLDDAVVTAVPWDIVAFAASGSDSESRATMLCYERWDVAPETVDEARAAGLRVDHQAPVHFETSGAATSTTASVWEPSERGSSGETSGWADGAAGGVGARAGLRPEVEKDNAAALPESARLNPYYPILSHHLHVIIVSVVRTRSRTALAATDVPELLRRIARDLGDEEFDRLVNVVVGDLIASVVRESTVAFFDFLGAGTSMKQSLRESNAIAFRSVRDLIHDIQSLGLPASAMAGTPSTPSGAPPTRGGAGAGGGGGGGGAVSGAASGAASGGGRLPSASSSSSSSSAPSSSSSSPASSFAPSSAPPPGNESGAAARGPDHIPLPTLGVVVEDKSTGEVVWAAAAERSGPEARVRGEVRFRTRAEAEAYDRGLQVELAVMDARERAGVGTEDLVFLVPFPSFVAGLEDAARDTPEDRVEERLRCARRGASWVLLPSSVALRLQYGVRVEHVGLRGRVVSDAEVALLRRSDRFRGFLWRSTDSLTLPQGVADQILRDMAGLSDVAQFATRAITARTAPAAGSATAMSSSATTGAAGAGIEKQGARGRSAGTGGERVLRLTAYVSTEDEGRDGDLEADLAHLRSDSKRSRAKSP